MCSTNKPHKIRSPSTARSYCAAFFSSKGSMHVYVYDSGSSSCYSFILNRWVPLFSTQACAMNYTYIQIPCSRAEGDFDLVRKSTCQHTHISPIIVTGNYELSDLRGSNPQMYCRGGCFVLSGKECTLIVILLAPYCSQPLP